MHKVAFPASAEFAAATHMVWLPGAYHEAQDFPQAGFATAVSRRQMALDLTFVDLQMEHLADHSALQRLRSEVLLPLRATGASVWLAGISLGGLFALDHAARHPDELDGVCVLAPYLGHRMLTTEIADAGGVACWQPGALAETDEERRVWRYIKGRLGARDTEPLPLYLGFGMHDRFAPAHELLARALPGRAVDRTAGGHDWRTWAILWENFLDSGFL